MCGIAGIVGNNLNTTGVLKHKVNMAIDVIKHRGPDEVSYYFDDNANLGICRLSIVDIESGQQPNFTSDKSIVSVFNGEIYNFNEVRNELTKSAVKLTSSGDAECIPFLYERFGLDFIRRLRGMFAIAIWDTRNKKLILARDRIGEKPLWFSFLNDRILFGSEIKSLFAMGITPQINLKTIPEYLQFGFIKGPQSSYENIHEVPPGSMLIFEAETGQYSHYQYWSPNLENRPELDGKMSLQFLDELVRNSVNSCLQVERPIGTFLSGGIDSSLVTAIASRESVGKLSTFSLGFKDRSFNEADYAKKIAAHLGTDHHEIILGSNINDILDEIINYLDLPFADSSIIPTYVLSKFARQEVVVALGGDGGDEVFGGYERYRANLALSRIRFLLRILPMNAINRLNKGNSKVSKVLELAKYSNDDERYTRLRSLIDKSEMQEILLQNITNIIEENYVNFSFSKRFDLLRQMQVEDLTSYLPGDLMRKTDLASMANSLEVRSPFLDHRIVEFGLGLPRNRKIGISNSKLPLRALLDTYVPSVLTNRPKMGFGVPMASWLRDELRNQLEENLLTDESLVGQFLNMNYVRSCVMEHRKGRDHKEVLWPVLVLELILKKWTKQRT